MIIKKRAPALALSAGILAFAFAPQPTALALSDTEADAIVATQVTAKLEHEEQQRAKLKEIPALEEWMVERDGGKTLFRRVTPPSSAQSARTETNAHAAEEVASHAPVLMERRSQKNVTLFITIVDGATTEIRSPTHPGLTAILAEDFSNLPAFLSIETDEGDYSFFSLVQESDTEAAPLRTRTDWVPFPSADKEYTIRSERDAPVPDAFSDMISLLRKHFLEHEEEFEANARKAESLQAARQRYRIQKPQEPPRETVINFWPIHAQAEEN